MKKQYTTGDLRLALQWFQAGYEVVGIDAPHKSFVFDLDTLHLDAAQSRALALNPGHLMELFLCALRGVKGMGGAQ